MLGQMMQQPLLIASLLRHAERHHGDREVVSRRVEGDIHRYSFRDLAARSRLQRATCRPNEDELRRRSKPRAPELLSDLGNVGRAQAERYVHVPSARAIWAGRSRQRTSNGSFAWQSPSALGGAVEEYDRRLADSLACAIEGLPGVNTAAFCTETEITP